MMIYVYDILLNWFQKRQVVDFFEWELNDELEHIKKIPLFKVDTTFMKDLYHSHIKLEISFLEKILDKTECYFHNEIEVIQYACLFSDGNKCIAVEFNEQGHSIYKSTLLLDEEEEVLELIEELTTILIGYQIESSQKKQDYLTRKERENKKYILKELNKIFLEQDIEKMSYLYNEYFNEPDVTLEEMYQSLKNYISDTASKSHDEILQILRLTSPHNS